MNQTYGDNRDLLNGYWVVTDVVDDKTVKINLDFLGNWKQCTLSR